MQWGPTSTPPSTGPQPGPQVHGVGRGGGRSGWKSRKGDACRVLPSGLDQALCCTCRPGAEQHAPLGAEAASLGQGGMEGPSRK